MAKRINPGTWTWFHEPKLYILSGDKLILETEPESTLVSFEESKLSAFGLLGEALTNFSYEARIDFMFQNVLDECGIYYMENVFSWF